MGFDEKLLRKPENFEIGTVVQHDFSLLFTEILVDKMIFEIHKNVSDKKSCVFYIQGVSEKCTHHKIPNVIISKNLL